MPTSFKVISLCSRLWLEAISTGGNRSENNPLTTWRGILSPQSEFCLLKFLSSHHTPLHYPDALSMCPYASWLCIWTNLTMCSQKYLTFCCLHVKVPGRTVVSIAGNRGGDGFWYVLTHGGLKFSSIQSDTENLMQPNPSVPTCRAACGPVSKTPAKLWKCKTLTFLRIKGKKQILEHLNNQTAYTII